MNTMMKKSLALVLAAGTMMSLAACGNSESSGSGSGSKMEISFETKNLKTGYKDYFESLIKEYEKQNPNIKIKWIDEPGESYATKLSTDAASGSLPDVVDMMPKDAYSLAKAGAIIDVTKIDKDASKPFVKGIWDTGVVFAGKDFDKGAYGFPWYLTAGITLYNKKVLEACGIDSSNLPKNWDEYYSTALKFAEKCGNKYMWKSGLPTIGSFPGYGVPTMNDDQTKFIFNTDKGYELVQHQVDLFKAGVLSKEGIIANGTQSTDLFKQGEMATREGFAYDIADLKQNAPEVYKNLIVVPTLGVVQGVNMEMLAVSSNSKHQKEAVKFAEFVTNNKNQVDFAKAASVYPPTVGGTDDPFFKEDDGSVEAKAKSIIAGSISKAESTDPPQFVQSDMDVMGQQLSKAALGQISAKQALDTIVENANKTLNQ